jgi:Tfp pilus assembly protein PilN
MATKEMTHLGTYVVPKVNLLPPEIDEKKAQQRAYVAMGALVVATIGAVGMWSFAQSARVGKAKDELATAQQTHSTLTVKRQQLNYVDEMYARVDANEAMLSRAVERRVPWSRNLRDLSLSMPDNVWLTKLTIAQKMDADKEGSGQGTVLADPGLGTLTFEGRSFTHDQVASWLDAMAKVKGYINPYFSKSEMIKPTPDSPPDERYYVKWTGTVGVGKPLLDSKSVTK